MDDKFGDGLYVYNSSGVMCSLPFITSYIRARDEARKMARSMRRVTHVRFQQNGGTVRKWLRAELLA